MKKKFFTYLIFSLLLASCFFEKTKSESDEKLALKSSIDSLEKAMFNQESMELDSFLALKQVRLFRQFADKFPSDSLSPEYLFRSSDLARSLGDNVNAIECLKSVCKNYPDYKKVPESLFLQGYYYQEFFGDTTQAKALYFELISKYPKHPFVDDAKALIRMFGKSEREIINDFEKKAEEMNSGF